MQGFVHIGRWWSVSSTTQPSFTTTQTILTTIHNRAKRWKCYTKCTLIAKKWLILRAWVSIYSHQSHLFGQNPAYALIASLNFYVRQNPGMLIYYPSLVVSYTINHLSLGSPDGCGFKNTRRGLAPSARIPKSLVVQIVLDSLIMFFKTTPIK